MLAGYQHPDDAMAEVLYRERFGLSSGQMDEEPAHVVEYWLTLESARRRQERRQRK